MRSQNISQDNNHSSLPLPRPSMVLQFDPNRIIAGICFHLRDEGMASSISEDSIRRATNRMERQHLTLSMSLEHWEGMDHRDRLHWLLSESHTVLAMAPNGAASLHRAEK